jgi:hypothetical protein
MPYLVLANVFTKRLHDKPAEEIVPLVLSEVAEGKCLGQMALRYLAKGRNLLPAMLKTQATTETHLDGLQPLLLVVGVLLGQLG